MRPARSMGWCKLGVFQGRELSSLGLSELRALLEEVQREDPPAVALLEAYLDRRSPDWRDAAAPARPASTVMDERMALEILGLPEGASEAEIKAAHRALMARLPPGSRRQRLSRGAAQSGARPSAAPPALIAAAITTAAVELLPWRQL